RERVIDLQSNSRSLSTATASTSSSHGASNTLFGYGACFNQWTRIWSPDGAFMERVAPGAFSQTLAEQGDRVRLLLEHGKDARAGNRPLGEIVSLFEDDYGLRFSAELFDVEYVNELRPALAAGQYSASFKFSPLLEDVEPRPKASAHNPNRL